jgi:hypothetical protein
MQAKLLGSAFALAQTSCLYIPTSEQDAQTTNL